MADEFMPPEGSSASEEPLVGRARELAELTDAFEHARVARGGVHLILGDPGVGKTRLAAALADHAAARGAAIVWTRGWGRASPAYWPWVEVVRSLCLQVDGAALRHELGPAADELLRLAPELAARLPGAQRPRDLAPGAESSDIARFALFDALVSLLRTRSSDAPVVVLMDDLQAVDEGSLVALDFVSRMLRDAAVLLVATMHERVPERSPEEQIALGNIARAGRRLVLGGLTPADIAQLIALASGSEPRARLAHAIHTVTEGNPFFAREIVALLLAEGRLEDPPDELPLPEGVRETIRRRLEPLAPPAVKTLELAAILGRTFQLAALEHTTDLDRDCVLTALEQATELGLVVELPATLSQYRFGHGLIRETLLANMPASARMAGHRAVGLRSSTSTAARSTRTCPSSRTTSCPPRRAAISARRSTTPSAPRTTRSNTSATSRRPSCSRAASRRSGCSSPIRAVARDSCWASRAPSHGPVGRPHERRTRPPSPSRARSETTTSSPARRSASPPSP